MFVYLVFKQLYSVKIYDKKLIIKLPYIIFKREIKLLY
jgi:hypothetical protein